MQGIVRELSGRKIIQWDGVTEKSIELCGNIVKPTIYNKKTIYSAGGTLSPWVDLGDIIDVDSEDDTMLRCSVQKKEISSNIDLSEVIKELRGIRELLAEALKNRKSEAKKQIKKDVYINPDNGQEYETATIKGIKCWIETSEKEIASGYRYVPIDNSDRDRFIREYGIVNGKGDY